MSLNFNIRAERKISFKKKNGKRGNDIQTVNFNCVQTPSKITESIISHENPINAYIDYIKSLSNPEQVPVYADDDFFMEREPVSFKHYDWTAEHIELLNKWIFEKEEEGYIINHFAI